MLGFLLIFYIAVKEITTRKIVNRTQKCKEHYIVFWQIRKYEMLPIGLHAKGHDKAELCNKHFVIYLEDMKLDLPMQILTFEIEIFYTSL